MRRGYTTMINDQLEHALSARFLVGLFIYNTRLKTQTRTRFDTNKKSNTQNTNQI